MYHPRGRYVSTEHLRRLRFFYFAFGALVASGTFVIFLMWNS